MGQVNVLAEFDRYGIEYEWATENELKVNCPFHDDKSPSCFVNVEKRVFICQTSGCGKKGDFIGLLARFMNESRAVIFAELSTRYDFEDAKIVDPDTIERYHARIWDAGVLRKALYDRGVSDASIRKHRLGESRGRITIPVRNDSGLYVNIRRYQPGAPGAEKMRNLKGHGKVRLFPIDQLAFDEIVVCGGEIKAIVAAQELNKRNIGAISPTCGEDNWTPHLSKMFTGKKVWVCNDIDEAGQSAAKTRCAMLRHQARWVGNVVLPLSIDKFPHGDINDFVVEGGKLYDLLKQVPEWEPDTSSSKLGYEDPKDTNLNEAVHADLAAQRIRLKAIVSAMADAPYSVPNEFKVQCNEDAKCCSLCPVMLAGQRDYDVHPESPEMLQMVGQHRSGQREALMSVAGIPRSCQVSDFAVLTYHNVEDVRLSPQLEITNRNVERVMQPAICVGDGAELNETYEMVGRMHPHPSTQQATLVLSSYTPTVDALSTYVLDSPDSLSIFQPAEWTESAIGDVLDCIYEDFEANVTGIYQRRPVHLAIDLTYHSPLFINFDGRNVKGWVETLIIGDSAQGKSETALSLLDHYGLGEKVECKNATVAGLLGGLQQMGTKWFATWGVIPNNDKRLVLLEELKGASTEVISKLTDMRSSGIAEIPKIERRRTHARTRIIATSNPRSDRPLDSYNYGIESIKELVGGLEDIRRFDLFCLVSAKDVDASVINSLQRERPEAYHRYTDELCRRLILWSWTRTGAYFEEAATRRTLEAATELNRWFSDAVPVLDRGSGRYKVARLAAALAARTFSHDAHYNLLVRKCHVDFIVSTLHKWYSSPTFGYSDFTNAIRLAESIVDEDLVKQRIETSPFPKDLCASLLHTDYITLSDLQDWCDWPRDTAQSLLSVFVRKRCFIRKGRQYRKTAPFITFLKKLLESEDFHDRPDFVEEEF